MTGTQVVGAYTSWNRKCMLEGLQKGVHKRNTLNVVQGFQQKPDEDTSQFLERIYQAYRKYTDADPHEPENVWIVNMTFLRQSALDIRHKCLLSSLLFNIVL